MLYVKDFDLDINKVPVSVGKDLIASADLSLNDPPFVPLSLLSHLSLLTSLDNL